MQGRSLENSSVEFAENTKLGASDYLTKDDEAVQAVLAYHPNFKEKAGCGVAYIKVTNFCSLSIT